MPTTPSGVAGLALVGLRDLLAQSATFRALLGIKVGPGAAAEAAAKEKIHYYSLPSPASGNKYTNEEMLGYIPYAIVSPSSMAHGAVASGTSVFFTPSGDMIIDIEYISSDEDEYERNVNCVNNVANIMDELCAVSGAGTNICLTSVSCDFNEKCGKIVNRDESLGYFMGFMIDVSWGTDAS